jgi:aryl-alcohol dehydrogenase-like predicted oxidoreductase
MRPAPYGAGLSRKAVLGEIDNSLRRLGTDYVDLYQIHRADPTEPIEETMEALHDVVKAGKARYVGASSMYAGSFPRRSIPPGCAAGRNLSACKITSTC